MSSIVATIQEIIRHELHRVRIAELGVVEEVYPHSADGDGDNYGCDVRLKNSALLLKKVPVATGHIGTVAIPNIGDLVLLAFDHGDINQPIVTGRLYNDEDRPPLNTTDEVIFRLPLHASDDAAIKSEIRNHPDQSPPRELLIEMDPKITVRITDGTVRITAGQTEMKLDQPDGSGGTVTAFAGGSKITMNQDGDIEVEALGAMRLKAQRDLSLEGMNVKIKGQLNAEMEAGAQATVKASMGAKVDGGLNVTAQGATVNVKGITSFSP
jgi:phage baseplate assembly protein gpV